MILHPNCIVDDIDLPVKYQYGVAKKQQEPAPQTEREAILAMFAERVEEQREEQPATAASLATSDAASSDSEAAAFAQVLPDDGINLKDMLADLEINMIRQALDKVGGVTARAAELLGMRRTTLVEKMKKYGITAKDL